MTIRVNRLFFDKMSSLILCQNAQDKHDSLLLGYQQLMPFVQYTDTTLTPRYHPQADNGIFAITTELCTDYMPINHIQKNLSLPKKIST